MALALQTRFDLPVEDCVSCVKSFIPAFILHLKQDVSAAALASFIVYQSVPFMQGQLLAVWRHSVSERDARTIVNAGIPVLVLHGRHDIVAAPRYGEALARRCGSDDKAGHSML